MLHFGKFQPKKGGAGGQDEIKPRRHESLVAAIDFAEAALGAVAVNGIADRNAGRDHAHAGWNGRRPGRPHPPSQEEGTAVEAAALLTNGAEVGVAPQALPGAQVHH